MASTNLVARSAAVLTSLVLLALPTGCGSESKENGEAKAKATSSPSASSSPSPSASATGPARTSGTPAKCLDFKAISTAIGIPMTPISGQPAQGVLKCTYIAEQQRALQFSLSTYVPEDAPGVLSASPPNFRNGLKIQGEDGGIGTKSTVFNKNPGVYAVVAYDDNGTSW